MVGMRLAGMVAGMVCLAAVLVSPARAQSLADFYTGKTIRIVVGSDAGGSYDLYSRLMARYMGPHVPGNPKFLVQNMGGAGGLKAANYVYNVAPQDGTVIGALQRAAAFTEALGGPGPQYESEKFQWLGSMNNEVTILAVMSRTGVATLDGLKGKEVIFGSSGPDGTEYYPALLNNVFGAKIKLIEGYPSTAAIVLAMARGEVDGVSQSYSTFVTQNPAWVRDGTAGFIVQMALEKHPDLPNVPLIGDLVRPGNLVPGQNAEELAALLRIQMSDASMGRPYTLGPGVPPDRVAALRQAFDGMIKDGEFLAEAQKSKREVMSVSGEKIQQLVGELKKVPRASLDKLADMIKYKGTKGNAPAEATAK